MPKNIPSYDLPAVLEGPDPAPLLALNFGFARARVLSAALELGVFTELARAPRTSAALAGALRCDGEAVRRLLDALTELGLVRGDDASGREVTELSRAHLVEGGPGFLGDHFAEVLAQWDSWGGLTDLVRSGRRGGDLGDPGARGLHRGMFGGVFALAARAATAVVEALRPAPVGRVLDLTAGGGEWGVALAVSDPTARVTAHDDLSLLAGARARVAELGLLDRFDFVPADFDRPPFPDGSFDTVVMAHAGRFAGPAAAGRLIQECARVLRPGGTLLIADVMRPAPGEPTLSRSMLDLSLLVNTTEGGLPEPDEYLTRMEKSGVTAKESVTRGLVTALTGERR
ncbi:class I SAM-dependent methyltransferase [Streptomyces sp. NPDC005865]|uniref:class I SAM-dependent methyltransferase n=1 Tax=Streptomyces sp. NPDC005865 TaxID=3155453 RepID=UPI00340AC666